MSGGGECLGDDSVALAKEKEGEEAKIDRIDDKGKQVRFSDELPGGRKITEEEETPSLLRKRHERGGSNKSESETSPPHQPLARSRSLPKSLRPDNVDRLLLARSRRTPSANIIKQEYRYASLRKVDKDSRRRRFEPLISAADHVLDTDVYQLVLTQSRRTPSANIIQKEFRYKSLRKVESEARRRRSEPLVGLTKHLLLDPDVYELLVARSRRTPSANVIKKEYRYTCLRKVQRTVTSSDDDPYYYDNDDDEDATSVSSISTILSNFHFDRHDDRYYIYDWIADLEHPMTAFPTMFPYYESSGCSDVGRRLSGSTLATRQSAELVLSLSSSFEHPDEAENIIGEEEG